MNEKQNMKDYNNALCNFFLTTRKTCVVCFKILYLANSLFKCFISTGTRNFFLQIQTSKCKEKTSLTTHTDHFLSEMAVQVSIFTKH